MSKSRHKTATPLRLDPSPARIAAPPPTDTPSTRATSEEDVRLRAYQKWEAAGRPPGDGVDFWLDAERELARGGVGAGLRHAG